MGVKVVQYGGVPFAYQSHHASVALGAVDKISDKDYQFVLLWRYDLEL